MIRIQQRRVVKCQFFSGSVLFAFFLAILAASSPSFAQTIAYWRFEEGPDLGQPVDQVATPGITPILDSSGNGFDMGTATAANAPTYRISGASVPFGAASNNFALDFANTPDSTLVQQEIFASGYTGGGVNDIDLAAGWTVEVSFMADNIPDRVPGAVMGDPNNGAFTTNMSFLTKQGQPVASKAEPPIVFRIRNDGDDDGNDLTLDTAKYLEVRGLDGSGDNWTIDSRFNEPLVAGQWYNAAVVYNGTTTDLYLDSGSGYKFQQGSEMAVSGWTASADDWVIGRGARNGASVGWFDGQVDEVRISNAALPQQDFLFNDPSDFDDVVEYTIDSTQSSWSWTGNVFGIGMGEQFPGSLDVALGGKILAHLSLDGNTLTFDDLSNIDMLENPAAAANGGFLPLLGTTTGIPDDGNPMTGPGAAAVIPANGEENIAFNLGPFTPGTNQAALRDAFFGIASGSATFGGPVTGIEMRTKSSRLDFFSDLAEDASADLVGGFVADNVSIGTMTRVVIPGVSETITIPVSFQIVTSGDGQEIFNSTVSGDIVAVRSLVSGDFDNDFDADGFDFLAWQRGFGSTHDAADLANWEANFGFVAPLSGLSGASSAVPEPASLTLLGLALALVPMRTVRRHLSSRKKSSSLS